MSSPDLERDLSAALRRAEAAEKTVAVLKKKVIDLYNGGQSSIQKQLESARRREEDNRRKRELMELKAAELKRYSETLEVEVARRTDAIRTILNNVTFGFLVVNRDLVVQDEATRSCFLLFDTDGVVGKNLCELLGLTGRKREEFILGADQVFEDILPTDVSLAQMPQKFALSSGRILRVEGRVIHEKEGNVSRIGGILFTISDITALEEATRESHNNRTLVGILKQKEAFQNFLHESKHQLDTARALLDRGDESVARRAIHTVKGNSASYGLVDLVHLIHDIEEEPRLGTSHLTQIEKWLRHYLVENYRIIEIDFDRLDKEGFEVSPEQMSRLRSIIATLPETTSVDLRTWTARVLEKPAAQLLGPVEDFTFKLAERLGKDIAFELRGVDLLLDVETMRPILQSVAHMIRNAVDHGIEPPTQRGSKSPRGRVSVSIHDCREFYELVVEDDGRGINVGVLAKRAQEKGLLRPEEVEKLSPAEKLRLIFLDGLSSAEVTTNISGRGVGMSAVQSAVQQAGGTISVQSTSGQGTRFVLRVPKPRGEFREDAPSKGAYAS